MKIHKTVFLVLAGLLGIISLNSQSAGQSACTDDQVFSDCMRWSFADLPPQCQDELWGKIDKPDQPGFSPACQGPMVDFLAAVDNCCRELIPSQPAPVGP